MEEEMDEVLIADRFQMLPACTTFYDVSLTRQNIMFTPVTLNGGKQGKLTSILMENVVGCKLYHSKLPNDNCTYFKVTTLGKTKKNNRERLMFTFRVNNEDAGENNAVAERWACIISWLLFDPDISAYELKGKELFPRKRRYFVVINPKSGPGKSMQWFKTTIEPLFLEASIEYEVLITNYAGHLTEAALSFDYTQWDVFVICSGDGLVFEFINGLMKRPDWNEVLKLPIGILPTGSGNALAASILYSAKEKFNILSAVYVLLKGRPHPMDLFSVFTQSQTFYGFLSMSWGIMSDIDIESEKLRAIGPIRFTIGALQRIVNLRHYKGILSFLPSKKLKGVESAVEVNENEHGCSSLDDSLAMQCDSLDCSADRSNAINSTNECVITVEHGIENDLSELSETSRMNPANAENSTPITTITVESSKSDLNSSTSSANISSSSSVQDVINSTNSSIHTIDTSMANGICVVPEDGAATSSNNETAGKIYGPQCSLPGLNEPLPDDWVTVDGEFVNLILTALSHIGTDMHCAPGTLINDGVLNLQYIKQGPKTLKLFKIFTSLESGKHVEVEDVVVDNVTAFRLVPEMGRRGNITVDGELINYEALQGEIHPSLANVIMMPVR